jgi:HPt (histidine-containing phosphotransfer) domain-containing protein
MNSSTQSVINLDFLRNFTGNNPARIEKYIAIFLQSAPPDVRSLLANYAEKNWEGVRAAAHSLKPQLTYMGIKSGETLLLEISHRAETQTGLDVMQVCMEDFQKVFDTACEELKNYLGR